MVAIRSYVMIMRVKETNTVLLGLVGLVVLINQQHISLASTQPISRIWTLPDLDPAFSVLNLGQMRPFFEKLEAGHPITVLAFGDSITKASWLEE